MHLRLNTVLKTFKYLKSCIGFRFKIYLFCFSGWKVYWIVPCWGVHLKETYLSLSEKPWLFNIWKPKPVLLLLSTAFEKLCCKIASKVVCFSFLLTEQRNIALNYSSTLWIFLNKSTYDTPTSGKCTGNVLVLWMALYSSPKEVLTSRTAECEILEIGSLKR